MTFQYPKFDVQAVETLEPNEKKAGDIFSRLGYKFWDAVADLVDNSVDANARNILIRFVRSAHGVNTVLIVDDGDGMNSAELREAMRFGSNIEKKGNQLGKYGIGLKSASLSQAEVVTVLSRKQGSLVGRRWKLQNIKDRWQCEILAEPGIRSQLSANFGDVSVRKSGTIIIWERLEHLQTLPHNLDRILDKTVNQLCIELGIRFHRFLSDKRLRIAIDQQLAGEPEPVIHRYVMALDPFGYDVSGKHGYPLKLQLQLDGVKFPVACHIWPPKSRADGYRLGGGKVALRQGFYFYRNDRVIQAGGWNGIRADDGEPHFSLARVAVDLPSELDSMFKLDVTKSSLDPTPKFLQALLAAGADGITFSRYLEDAEKVYRRQKHKDSSRFPFVPGKGLPVRARNAISRILNEKGVKTPAKVDFSWARLDPDEIVRLDLGKKRILLNAKFKDDLVEGRTADAPVLKVTLMFLLQKELEKSIRTKKSNDWMQRFNQALIASLKKE
jgi:hypothetical protein